GFGKTVLCASWLNKRAPRGRMAWITLDPEDREPARFWARVGTALFGSSLQAASADAGHAHRDLLKHRLDELGRGPEQLTLVLDDVHELADSPAVDDLDFLLRHAPSNSRVILLCRRVPGLQLARLRLAGQLATIDPADLACTPIEVQQFLEMHGIIADSPGLAQMVEYTQGWIAGLRLLALSGNGAPNGGKLGRPGVEERELVTDYVRDEFLAGQDDERRTFLLRTSLAETLTVELADILSGTDNSARIIDQLRREHGFVEGVDGLAGSYRYHPMIRSVLRAELERDLPREIPVLQHRIGRWHHKYGRPVEALRCALAAGDKESVYRLLADDDVVLYASNPEPDVERLLDDLAADLATEDPAVTTALAATRLRCRDVEGARALLDEAEAAAAVAPTESARLYALKHAALRLAIAVQDGPLDPHLQVAGWRAAESARGRLTGIAEHRARGWLVAILGITHLAQGELPPARHALHMAERDLSTVGPRAWHERVSGWLALAEATDGRLTRAKRLLDQATPESPIAGLFDATQALVHIEQAEPVQAQRLAGWVDPWPVECLLGEPDPGAVLGAVRYRLHRAQADLGRAFLALGQMRDAAGTYATALAPLVAVAEADLAPAHPGADLDARLNAIDWPDDDSQRAVWPVSRDLLRAWYLVDGDPATAIEIATGIIERRASVARLLDRISAMLVRAVGYRRLGRKDVAAAHLDEALALAAPEHARQVFLDCGKPVRALLTVLLPAESRFAGFAAGILQRFESPVGPRAVDHGGKGELTESEREIMRYLSSHLTNEEIAADLCLSVNTVKTHLRAIYRKLGVSSRRAALAAAGAQGLL
ncbi:MAG TPA: LuxR C-terminal-related transcriptional regulator, partial [Actinomycetes bacterium]|nr:LuxR C-terminal-related transcriptional regulator [Actinomycetes bacterium]